MYKYKTIIFDLDGTLFRTDTIFVEALSEVCAARDIKPWSKEKTVELIGKPMVEICKLIFGEDTTAEEIEQIRTMVRKVENNILLQKGKLYDEVIHMLDKLKNDDYTLCLCTNGSRQYVDKIIKSFELEGRFDVIKSRIEGLSKSQLIKQILDETGCCSAIVVGDRKVDYEAAEDTGCLSIGVSYGYGGKEYEKADFIAHSPMEIYHIINKVNNFYNKILDQIYQKKSKDKPFVVGINGVDTSGKTEFTRELANYLTKTGFKVQVINIDDFLNPSNIRSKDPDPIMSYINNGFNLQRVENELLEPITSEGYINKELLLLDLQKDEFNILKKYEADEKTIVLIEGVLLYREPIDKYFNFRIYLHISFEEVLKRACKRDGYLFGDAIIEKYQQKYIPIQKVYIEKYKPKERSDMIINNEDYRNPVIDKLKISQELKINSNSSITLQPVEPKHYDEIREMHIEDEARDMLGVIELPDKNYFTDKSNICYAILNNKDEFVGIIELFNLSWKNRRAELSIVIKSAYRGKGYGTEATRKLLDIAFGELGFNRIWLRVLEHNKKAIECYKKVGFIQEGVCREESLRRGEFKNQVQMSILRSEWLQKRREF